MFPNPAFEWDGAKARHPLNFTLYPVGELMKNLAFIVILSLISPLAIANSTICKPYISEESLIGIKAFAWDSSTLVAKVTDMLNNTHEGKVTLVREHKPYGVKTNIFIKYRQPYHGEDAAEYVVFPTGKNQFRVKGVTYIFRNNEYHLSTSEGNYSATCLSM